MKNYWFPKTFILLLAFGLLSSCGKTPFESEDGDTSPPLEQLVADLHESFFEFDVLGGDENSTFRFEHDGMHGIYSISPSEAERIESNRLKLISCLRSSNPTPSQLIQLRVSSIAFMQCRFDVGQAYRIALRGLLNSYEPKRQSIITAVQSGNMNTAEGRLAFERLRNAFRSDVMEVKKSHHETFKTCLKTYLESIKNNLTTEQWSSFNSCMRN